MWQAISDFPQIEAEEREEDNREHANERRMTVRKKRSSSCRSSAAKTRRRGLWSNNNTKKKKKKKRTYKRAFWVWVLLPLYLRRRHPLSFQQHNQPLRTGHRRQHAPSTCYSKRQKNPDPMDPTPGDRQQSSGQGESAGVCNILCYLCSIA